MPWASHTAADDADLGHATSHADHQGRTLEVEHWPHPLAHHTHSVIVRNNPGTNTPSAVFRWPSTAHGGDKAYTVHQGDPEYHQGPSDDLKALIEAHGKHPDQWAPLLDKLAEEYPHLQPAIDAHVAHHYS